MNLYKIPYEICDPKNEQKFNFNIITFILQEKPLGNFLYYLPEKIN
jgi:hypothetical protein